MKVSKLFFFGVAIVVVVSTINAATKNGKVMKKTATTEMTEEKPEPMITMVSSRAHFERRIDEATCLGDLDQIEGAITHSRQTANDRAMLMQKAEARRSELIK